MAEYVTLKKADGTIIYPQTGYEDLMELVRPYDIGDTLTVNGGTFMAGYISSSATQILATLVLPKTISSNVTSITVSGGGTFTSRGITGYLLATATVGTDITVEAAIPTVRNSIRLTIKNADSSAFSVTNNTPVTTHGNFTITFS